MAFTTQVDENLKKNLMDYIAKDHTKIPSTIEGLRDYLTCHETMISPDFILRRHIQTVLEELVQEYELPDLDIEGNVPWDDEVIEELSDKLYLMFSSISSERWYGYLSGSSKPIRKIALQLILDLKMPEETAQKFLLSLDVAPFSARIPLDLIVLFCIRTERGWNTAKEMYEKFEGSVIDDIPQPAEDTDEINSSVLFDEMDQIVQSTHTDEDKQMELLKLMYDNREAFELFIKREDRKEGYLPREKYIAGHSKERIRHAMELAEILVVLYPLDEKNKRNKETLTFASLGRNILRYNSWGDLSWKQTEESYFDELQNRLRFKAKRDGDPGWVRNLQKVDLIAKGGKDAKAFSREDALLFTYFLIKGILAQPQKLAEINEKISALWMNTEHQSSKEFLQSLKSALDRLVQIHDTNDNTIMDKHFKTIKMIFYYVLKTMDFYPLYMLMPLDRLVILSLLNYGSSLLNVDIDWKHDSDAIFLRVLGGVFDEDDDNTDDINYNDKEVYKIWKTRQGSREETAVSLLSKYSPQDIIGYLEIGGNYELKCNVFLASKSLNQPIVKIGYVPCERLNVRYIDGSLEDLIRNYYPISNILMQKAFKTPTQIFDFGWKQLFAEFIKEYLS